MRKFAKAAVLTALSGLTLPAFAVDEIESRAFYSTNPGDCVGKYVTSAPSGASFWTDDMMIATCGANDMATAFKGSHENNVLDTYALYAAWDDSKLYIAWQMVNTGDTWAREGDGPLTDYGHIGDVPLIVALSIDPSTPCMNGMLEDGRFIWGDNGDNGVTFTSHVDRLFFMSGKPGSGDPSMFTASDAAGNTNYGANCKLFSSLGVTYTMEHAYAPSHLWRQKTTADYDITGALLSDPEVVNNIYDIESYDNLLGDSYPAGLKPHSHEFDSFYTISIPFSALGITREWLEENGIGCRIVATRGESGIDCIPFDPSMVDNVFGSYGKDASTSHEKDDIDNITYALANIGKMRTGSVTPPPGPGPDEPDPDDPDPDDPTPPADGNYVIYFDNTSSNWSKVYTWIWDANDGNKNYTGGTWPGDTMTFDNVAGYHRYSFTCVNETPKLMCIFNPGGDNGKTGDLELQNHGLYNAKGFVRILDSPSGVETITSGEDAPVVYYTLQGQRVDNPSGGIFIVVKEGKSSKVMM